MANIQQNDAAGGAGSLLTALQNIAINGVSRAVDGALSKKYPLTSFNDGQTVNAEGEVKPRAAPQTNVSATTTIAGALNNPVVIGAGVAIVAAIVVVLVLRK